MLAATVRSVAPQQHPHLAAYSSRKHLPPIFRSHAQLPQACRQWRWWPPSCASKHGDRRDARQDGRHVGDAV